LILVLDNYDSFTYNLVECLEELGRAVVVWRNDAIAVEEVLAGGFEAAVLSPGPGVPAGAGISLGLVDRLAGRIPLLGVCLGHQVIAQAFGSRIVPAPVLMHGKTSEIHHDGRGMFDGLPQPFRATRYHSLTVERESLAAKLEVSAWTADGTVMGLRHRELPLAGVQFHPESVLTAVGKQLLANWLVRVGGERVPGGAQA
jgi:anthranilate synthase/aminodeoxychorismate synthase-like glutamine amidotransferase